MRAKSNRQRNAGILLLTVALSFAALAPWFAPRDPNKAQASLQHAPPTRPHVRDAQGRWHAPFIYRLVLLSQLEERYEEDRSLPIPLVWIRNGRLVTSSDDEHAPLLLLGADSYGRDVFGRLAFGARMSFGLAVIAAAGALLCGLLLGGVAGYAGGILDEGLMRASDVMVVLPLAYVVLALRAVLPLTLPSLAIFTLLAIIFTVVGAPSVARGVRAIVRSERHLDYAAAATSLGAGHTRVLVRHLLPASLGFLGVQATILVPAFIVAEATLSYVGLGFSDPVITWGTMLHEVSDTRAFTAPWLLSPGIAIFLMTLALNLTVQGGGTALLAVGARTSPTSRGENS